jgi:Chitobiase/beta-hexosaminidase C-terminal domain
MKKLILTLALLISAPCLWAQTTYTAAGCSQAQVQAAITAEHTTPVDGDIIAIPACPSGVIWSTGITQTFANSVTIQGAGAISSTSGGGGTTGTDQTVLLLTGGSSLFNITTTAGKSFRLTGIAFTGQTGQPVPGTGVVYIGGTSTSVRVDHCHFHIPSSVQQGLYYAGAVNGVGDHDYFTTDNNGLIMNAILFFNGELWGGQTNAHGSWADSPNWGTSKFIFQEDNRFVDVGVTDMNNGARFVFRYNTVVCDSSASEQCQMFSHGITSGLMRGFKEAEVYKNTWTSTAPNDTGAMQALNSGTELFWGNTATGTWKAMLQVGYDFRGTAGAGGIYNYPAPPAGWGFCGPGTSPASGTMTITSGGVATAVTGSFSTSWPANSPILINGNSHGFQIVSVASSSQLQLGSCSNGSCGGYTGGAFGSPVSWNTASGWDGNLTQRGYACLGQPGRGQGDLLSGSTFGTLVNSTTGTVAWPHEKLTPIYSWMNTYTSTHYGGVYAALNDGVPTNTNNVDFFFECGVVNGVTNPSCSSFTGAAGTGFGTLASRPSGTCTGTNTDPMGLSGTVTGAAYWETDHNQLDFCVGTGVAGNVNGWTTLSTSPASYAPYTYPHPLTGGGGNPQAATPAFSPGAGAYPSTQTVTITTASPGAIICYNTTGAPATNGGAGCAAGSLLYAGPVTVSVNETLFAVAGGVGYLDSTVGSAAYFIGILPPSSLNTISVL